jgi:hypothetical protein
MMSDRFRIAAVAVLAFTALASAANAGPFDGVLKGMEDSVNRRTQDLGEKAVDKTFDQAEEAAGCAVGDEECLKRKREQAGEAPAAAAPGAARCIATDVDCLQAAKKRGQTVEIVDESELDTVRCAIDDTACMQRAKKLGKKVELE